MNKVILCLAVSLIVILPGCAANPNMPLIFTQSQTVGISIGAGANEQGADFVLGYKDKNIAIVPIAIADSDGSIGWAGSTSGENFEDAFSVLGQFEVSSATGQGNVGLGKFFATGAAAKALADGFNCQLAGPQSAGCNGSEPEEVVEDEQAAEETEEDDDEADQD